MGNGKGEMQLNCRMKTLQQANSVCWRLYREDSGVVLALSVVSFLILFVVACAGYAIGETVRQRVELQNAADAAAYSGAIVQADTISRVAAINRAMSWTYVKLCRMEMDAIVDKWLELVLRQWNIDEATIQAYNAPSCNKARPLTLWNGRTQAMDKQVWLNYNHTEAVQTIQSVRGQAAGQQKSYQTLKPKIKLARDTIKDMNKAQQDLIDQLKDRIEKTVKEVVEANIEETFNDRDAGGAAIKHVCLVRDGYFRILKNNEQDETRFLTHSDFDKGPKETFDKGTDTWFVRDNSVSEGIARKYKQAGGALVAKWQWYSSLWVIVDGACVFSSRISGESEVKGQDGYDSTFYETGTAKPQVLKKEFFGKDGAIVVGIRRKLNNPFAYIFSGGQPGIFNAFTPPGGTRYMWSAAAARAGFRQPKGSQEGEYEVTFEDDQGKIRSKDEMWNLKTSDWDAVLLSLHRAWADGRQGRMWSGETAAQVLQEVEGQLGVAGQPAAPGMSGGAFSAGGAENLTMH